MYVNNEEFGVIVLKTDIEIAQSNVMLPIKEVAAKLSLTEDDLILYGKYKAKVAINKINSLSNEEDGKLILVTAINPTPAGEGKSTVTVGLGDALTSIGKKAMIAMREPSLGPTMGVKGGAAGGGYAQVQPMQDINLHFTGDMHAITATNNTLSALIDNHIQQGNQLNIDQRRITWKRVLGHQRSCLKKNRDRSGRPCARCSARRWFRYYGCERNHGHSLLGDFLDGSEKQNRQYRDRLHLR